MSSTTRKPSWGFVALRLIVASTCSRGSVLEPSCVEMYVWLVPCPSEVLVTRCELGGRYVKIFPLVK
jgi:hypothetical protein